MLVVKEVGPFKVKREYVGGTLGSHKVRDALV
jgi:hypothetical protein